MHIKSVSATEASARDALYRNRPTEVQTLIGMLKEALDELGVEKEALDKLGVEEEGHMTVDDWRKWRIDFHELYDYA
jgi:hypothetical protein